WQTCQVGVRGPQAPRRFFFAPGAGGKAARTRRKTKCFLEGKALQTSHLSKPAVSLQCGGLGAQPRPKPPHTDSKATTVYAQYEKEHASTHYRSSVSPTPRTASRRIAVYLDLFRGQTPVLLKRRAAEYRRLEHLQGPAAALL